jgi:hypothetical protein
MKIEILLKIKNALENPNKGRNSMGCSESFYDPNFMVGKCFSEEELTAMDESQLNNLIKLASFASEVFY